MKSITIIMTMKMAMTLHDRLHENNDYDGSDAGNSDVNEGGESINYNRQQNDQDDHNYKSHHDNEYNDEVSDVRSDDYDCDSYCRK